MTENKTPTPLDEDTEIESVAPEQQATHKWEFKPRQQPKWGTVTKAGLEVGRGANKKVIPPDEVYYLASLGCNYRELAECYYWSLAKINSLRAHYFDWEV